MMSAHLYNSRLGKISWFVRRFGLSELFCLPLRKLFSPWVCPRLQPRTFRFRDRDWDCFYHDYNVTWCNERCVEVPVGLEYLERFAGKAVLEVGNVLSHYESGGHTVLDKYERAPGIVNEDIVGYQPANPFDLVLSISTLEHIGFDDDAPGGSGEKILEAIGACRALLATGGLFAFTVPLGYNSDLDRLIADNALGADREWFLKRSGPRDWAEAPRAEAQGAAYRRPYPYANALLIAEYDKAN
jgi:hypothetical protein